MGKQSDIEILGVDVSTQDVPFRAPLKFGGRVVDGSENINAEVTVRTRSGKEATGFGSMPLGNVWAWPSKSVEPDQTAEAMRSIAQRVGAVANDQSELAHPLDHGIAIQKTFPTIGKEIGAAMGIEEEVPMLAILVAASSIDAAIHDAFGKANEINSFNGLSAEFMNHDLSHYLSEEFAGEYLDQYTLREPKETMPLYHLVGALDPLTEADIEKPIKDGRPETLGEWIEADGLTHLKIKLSGEDLPWDVDRVVAIDRIAEETQGRLGREHWFYSLDFNEKCEGVHYVLNFLQQIEQLAPRGLERIQYIEQPTHRDLKKHPIPMHEAAKIKPVVIDESLLDFESLLLAREIGYSGVALKACKGHTESLLLAAAAQKYGMFLCVQDLTCPGASFLHSAELAARIPTVAAIEGNGRQYCPAGNAGWKERFPSMFEIEDGTVGTYALGGVGLGH
ncbi:hypothetical protein Pan216_06530 [Planctomycetes bacterium Pan216]|uniref:Enolase C-terminal domain-containing protein n=1 Tax=Kolteria novifilia TaxID=2527975 RepID=A0A518AYP9_9BACT|nr:hypothetical protein Pan216_06530 [Planctomycetes bacterium Pan216]